MLIVLKEWCKNKGAFVLLILATLMGTAHIAIQSILLIAIKNAVDDTHDIMPVLYVGIASLVLGPIGSYLKQLAIQKNFRAMSLRWHDKLVSADFQLFTKNSCSKIFTVGEFLWSATNTMTSLLTIINCVVTLLSVIISMAYLEGMLIIPVMIVYIVLAVIFKKISAEYGKCAKDVHAESKKRNQEMEDSINGFAEIRAFGTQEEHNEKMLESTNRMFDLKMHRARISLSSMSLFEIVELIGVAVVLIICFGQMESGLMTPATVMTLISLVMRLIDPVITIVDIVDSISDSTAKSHDFAEIMGYINSTKSGDLDISAFENDIEISNLSFAYSPDSAMILKNINMTIKKGERVAIVGGSGNGKSTLAKLLLHFYEPGSGSISIDGVDIRDVTDKSFRKIVGAVQQENCIFPGSIWDNVRYGSEHALESEVVDACKKADIYDFIMSLPEKFDTEVGPKGLKLSGGQKQRIALARIFLKNPEIIVLDEATSALDNTTESSIQRAIDNMQGKTLITIAHRLSTIKDYDKIYVIDKNTVAECGTHDELIAAGGIYAKMQK